MAGDRALNPLYQHLEYCDIHFSRDASAEIVLRHKLFGLYSKNPLFSYWSFGCDPGYRARETARHGMKALGLYVTGQIHQRNTSVIGYGPIFCRTERDGKKATLDWSADVKVDSLNQIVDVNLGSRVKETGRIRMMRHPTRETSTTPPFLAATALLSDVFEPVAWYENFDLQQPYDGSENSDHCSLPVFRKTATA